MMAKIDSKNPTLDLENQFYKSALLALRMEGIPFLVGGSFAFSHYTPIGRFTKDVDIFIEPENSEKVLRLFSGRARTERTHSHWLIKIISKTGLYMDVIFNSGNGVCKVDRRWFDFSEPGKLLNVPVDFCPLEEMIWMKAYVMERDRFDGADISHLIYHCAHRIHWNRLLERFGSHWRVLLSHLVLFGFVYPDRRSQIPAFVMDTLLERLFREQFAQRITGQRICLGTLLSGIEYRHDLDEEGYMDPRLSPLGKMSSDQIEAWEKNLIHS